MWTKKCVRHGVRLSFHLQASTAAVATPTLVVLFGHTKLYWSEGSDRHFAVERQRLLTSLREEVPTGRRRRLSTVEAVITMNNESLEYLMYS